ncbi:glycosyltransferase [Clostridium tagluense]|uniref:glycosyltransferase n=1 Tax=Clostridium tagluense TaxID=360422 RepID=UPI001CF5E28E|nr:glycosyltransferase [Clostridium tagluense]MCB2312025.1 glycosyltransferase [Clostridium tagluense]MCB2316612.1 glycosyltransferase [Clostridium tagluense]MCB2321452.1 glycosyltransferase [Clostridium tagluense]MCB2326464.1 glycosyltransferase [Clostridium tagluense]MCB2331204.1 glycosyltransferase [Clostridium tagluense]
MKILHLLSSNKFSGAENVACQIINMFKGEIDMLYCSPEGPIAESLIDKSIKYRPIKSLSVAEVKRSINEYKPDIIHAHDFKASVLAVLCTKQIPIISHLHGKKAAMSKLSLKSLVYKVFLKRIKKVIVVSKSILNEFYFKNDMEDKTTVLYNVVNAGMLKKIELIEYKFDCVYLGRFVYEKNPERLIEIISMVVKRLPDAKIVLIGDGVLLDKAKQLSESLNLNNNITFTGFIANPYEILASSKIMIMSSRTEGTPMCLLESMALGVPIVSTPVDGIKELIENEVDGFYYEKDEDIVNAICRLIVDKNLRGIISDKIYTKAISINNIENYKSVILSVYESSLNAYSLKTR